MTHPVIVPLATLASVVLRQIVAAIEARNDWTVEQKRRIPLVLCVLGAAVSVASYLAGLPADEATVAGGGVPIAVLVNEVANAIKRKPPGPPAAPSVTPLVLAFLSTCLVGCAAAYQALGSTADGFQLAVGRFEVYNAARRSEILAEAKPLCATKAITPEVEACFAAAIAPFEASRRPVSACIDSAAPLVRAAEVAVKAKDAKTAASLLPEVAAGATRCGLKIEEYMKATKKSEVK